MTTPPLGLYIHLPWCERKCPYCDFTSHAAEVVPYARSVDALLRALEAAREPPVPGQRVRLWGISGERGRHQDELFGRVERVDAARLEVVLDVPPTLEGWGGAPILAADSASKPAILQAA